MQELSQVAKVQIWREMHWKNWLFQKAVSLFKSSSFNKSEEKRFLILSTTGLGDTLWATPAIKALREQLPSCYIAVLTSPIGHQVLQHNSDIDALFIVKDPVLKQLLTLYRTLKKKNITHVLSFHVSQRPILPLAALIGAQSIIGTKGLHKGLDFLLTEQIESKNCHEIERRLDIVRAIGIHPTDYRMHFDLSAQDVKMADSFLRQCNVDPNIPLIGIHPGAKDRFKQWPAEHFISLGNRLSKHKCQIFVTGIPSEQALVTMIAAHIDKAIPVTHLPLNVTAALIQRMQLMITNDTGPMHVAFALKTPTLALFSPTQPQLCGPYAIHHATVIVKSKTCSPCLKKKCREPFCLLQIGVEEVYDAAIKLF